MPDNMDLRERALGMPDNAHYGNRAIIETIGTRYGKYVIIGIDKIVHGKNIRWLCRCDCGNICSVQGRTLRSGQAKGCRKCCKTNLKHGDARDGHRTHLYKIWNAMKGRCETRSFSTFKNYGGRGISVCDEWSNDYLVFKKWAHGAGYAENLELDRIDNNGNYCPENCQWITHKKQQYNKRTSRIIMYNGVSRCLAEWAEIYGIKYSTLYGRYQYKWPVPEMFRPTHTGVLAVEAAKEGR